MTIRLVLLVLVSWVSLLGCAGSRAYLEKSPAHITEIHYDPTPEQGKVEFIEISNLGREPADLSGWQVTGAGRIVLPEGTVLRPGESLILCKDGADFRTTFGATVTPVATFEDGKLKNSGETVRLEDPLGRIADEASYDPSNPEVQNAGGTGLSIHRIALKPTGEGGIWRAAQPNPGVAKAKR